MFCGMADGPAGLLPQGMMDVVGTAVGRDRPGDGWAPLWAATLDPADRGALDPGIPNDLDRHPDVLVVGGGVMGLATALFCRESGLGRVRGEHERAPVDRDREGMDTVRPWWNLHLQRKRAHDALALVDPELELMRWMLEEWRVAVFSQELGTVMPVSERRVEKQMEKVRRV